jgi:cyclophilin family peptidyl-prolyl cis-trans isomerase
VYRHNPRVVIDTTRGPMEFELFPAEAPIHVHNFLTLASKGHYDGTLFHRVVPDFVIQGGDYRGDGNGGTTWRGTEPLRHEIGPRKYVRGSLGMPRNEDWDSGGSQVFVTHRPTPHLDGRYTIFGELRRGGDVLDAIEVGDRILGVRFL